MSTLVLTLIFSFMMSVIALVGGFALILPEHLFHKIIQPMVSLAAGTLIGGAFFHLLPQAVDKLGNEKIIYIALVSGFVLFFILEQFLNWHHCHRSSLKHQPVSYLILFADGFHNFIGGLTIGSAFLIDARFGMIIWLIAVAHEIPQELGDFGILVHSGWSSKKALLFNMISALTFPIGAVLAYLLSGNVNVSLLLPFAAGNFLYIGAADLIPQLHSEKLTKQLLLFLLFAVGLLIMLLLTWF
ncbi:ZIP family metal transporter [Legionella israelensis]|uniref:Zinc transporter ZupT n=2 Tax=Legionella israelensis TaxID=454 RepID=A0A0W0VKX2_9GAMM|nr:ZIP family metal transporter [Legionella israelensis]KTD20473.1 zinc transporter ZupT [Legionella israelensis]SCX86802.1 zinc and cadmium transporter [Legionella israelensis DSM 19235]STX57826.1 zinc transporter ZupT [Legionella israelensis]